MGGILTQLLAGLAGGTNAYEHQQDTAAKEKIAAELHQAQVANIQSEMQNRQEQRYTQGFRPGQAPDAKGILAGLNLGAGVADAGGAPGVSVASQFGNAQTQAASPEQYAPDRYSQVNPSTYIDNTATPEAVQSRHDERSAINAMRIAAAKPTPQQHVVDPVTGEVKFYDPTHPPASLKVNPQPRDAFSFPVVTGEDGKNVVARANTKTGAIEPTTIGARTTAIGGGRGAATLQRAVATNTKQIAVIDDALKELDAHPSAVGMLENGRSLPFIGDQLDQRNDPTGVAARASIANIGSLQIHDRTGAAMTVHEEPRLAPFVPNIRDTPDAIRTKLRKLRESIIVETNAIRSGGSGGTPAGAPVGGHSQAQALWDAAVAKHGEAKVLAEYGPRPQE